MKMIHESLVAAACAAGQRVAQRCREGGSTMQARHRFRSTLGLRPRLIALAVLLALPAGAGAQTFTFTATDAGSGTFSYGVLEATPNGDGSYTATDGYLVVLSGPIAGIYDLDPNPNPPHAFVSPSGAFFADNVLYPGQGSTLDGAGLLFTGNGTEVNIWGNGAGNPNSYWAFAGSSYVLTSNDAAFTLATTPAQIIGVLQDVVQALADDGANLPAGGNSLQAKLDAALAAVGRGNTKAAAGSLNAFINQVEALISSGRLTAVEGQSLIDQATAAIGALGG
jgi:hypothetical protein